MLTFRTITSNSYTGTTGSVTISAPPDLANGDLIQLQVITDNGTATPTCPGFTAAVSTDYPRNLRQTVLAKTAASEPSSWTVTTAFNTTNYMWIVCMAVSGLSSNTLDIAGELTESATSTTGTIPSVTTTEVDAAFNFLGVLSTAENIVPPGGVTQVYNLRSFAVNYVTMACFYQTQAAAGPTGANVYTYSTAVTWMGSVTAYPYGSAPPPTANGPDALSLGTMLGLH